MMDGERDRDFVRLTARGGFFFWATSREIAWQLFWVHFQVFIPAHVAGLGWTHHARSVVSMLTVCR